MLLLSCSANRMSSDADKNETIALGAGQFATTDWRLVNGSQQSETTNAREALEALCRLYWPPLYAYARRQGKTPPDAQDLTQAFVARLLERRFFGAADPARGRFRTFL